MGKISQAIALDTFDREALAILQRDNLTLQRTTGEAINLSAPAVQRSIKRMTDGMKVGMEVSVGA
jgi:DNA-binding Lrp family transcriptional regulator